MLISIALLVVFAAATSALFVGVRGKRVDDHPLCKRCGFDLIGKPADSNLCSECGADLGVPRAIHIGHRRRRRAWVGVSLLILGVDVAIAGAIGWFQAKDVNWLHYCPTMMLLHRAASIDSTVRQPALNELLARDNASQLSPSQWVDMTDSAVAYEADPKKPWESRWATLLIDARVGRHFSDVRWDQYLNELLRQCQSVDTSRRNPALVELLADFTNGRPTRAQWDRAAAAALAVQGDAHKAWTPAWGDLVETAEEQKQLSDDNWRRYAAQSWPGMFGLRVRPAVRRGDPLPFWIDCNAARVSTHSKLGCSVSDMTLRFDAKASTKSNGARSSMSCGMHGGSATGSSLAPNEFPDGLADGNQPVHVSGQIKIGVGYAIYDAAAPELSVGTFDLAGTTALQPADRPTVAVVHNPALLEAVQKSIKIEQVTVQSGAGEYTGFSVSTDGTPVGVGFEIFVRQGDREISAGTISCPAGTRNHSYGMGVPTRLNGPTVDIVFRSSPAAAASTTDTFEAWEGELRYQNLPVIKSK